MDCECVLRSEKILVELREERFTLYFFSNPKVAELRPRNDGGKKEIGDLYAFAKAHNIETFGHAQGRRGNVSFYGLIIPNSEKQKVTELFGFTPDLLAPVDKTCEIPNTMSRKKGSSPIRRKPDPTAPYKRPVLRIA